MCILMGKRLAVFLNSFFFHFKVFLVKNENIDFLKEKMVLRVDFIKWTFRWSQTGLSDLKSTKQLKFCLWWILTHF